MNTEKKLYQWDTGQKLAGCTGLYVDFPIGDEVYRVETTDGTCIIPDELLQTSGGHKVYECMTNNTIRSFAFSVTPRPKPPEYVFTPTERLTFEGLVQKVDDAVADMIRRAESGEFDGHTPIKGTDYFTTEEIRQIQNEVSSGAIGDFKSVVDTETETFNINAETKLNAYNQNNSQKINTYNTNATEKLNAYNTNANNRVAEFDTHTEQIQTDISGLKSDLVDIENEVFDITKTQEWVNVNVSVTTGKYVVADSSRTTNGIESVWANGSHTEFIPCSNGERYKVTGNAYIKAPLVVFYKTNEYSNDAVLSWYTEETAQHLYTDAEVTIPQGANYFIVNSCYYADKVLPSAKRLTEVKTKESKIEKNNINIHNEIAELNFYDSAQFHKIEELSKKNDFAWNANFEYNHYVFDKGFVTIRVDDLNQDVDLVAKIVTEEFGYPLVVACIDTNLDNQVIGITTQTERIGETGVDICKWVDNHGGEIVSHNNAIFTSADYETLVKPYMIDVKKNIETKCGISVNGIAVARQKPTEAVRKDLDKYLYCFYDYSDGYGYATQYNYAEVNIMSGQTSVTSLDEFGTWLEQQMGWKRHITLVFHKLDGLEQVYGTALTPSHLRNILNVIKSVVDNGSAEVVTWRDMHNRYGTTVFEKRLSALENS